MFGLWLPHSLITTPNPIFDYELHRLRWPHSTRDMTRYSRTVIFGVCLVFLLWWAVGQQYNSRYNISEESIVIMLGFLTIAVTLVSNFYYALLTVGTINREITSSQWDQLRLTGQGGERILLAKYAILQIRSWRLMVVDTALRVAALGVFALIVLYSTFGSPSGIFLLLLSPFAWVMIVSLIVLGSAYSLEPLWRMRAVISVALAISTRVHSLAYALLGVLGFIILIYVAQLLILAAFLFIATNTLAGSEDVYLVFFCGVPLLSAAAFYACYAFFRLMRDRSMEYAFRVGLGGQNLRSYIYEQYWN
jgi:hypothetical protein